VCHYFASAIPGEPAYRIGKEKDRKELKLIMRERLVFKECGPRQGLVMLSPLRSVAKLY
jgi:hypothetical protein